MKVSTAELAYLLAAMGDGRTRVLGEALGIPRVGLEDPLSRAGVSSLLLRGAARAVGEGIQITPELVVVAAALVEAESAVSIGVGTADVVAVSVAIRSAGSTLICTPMAWELVEFSAAPAVVPFAEQIASWTRTAFADPDTITVGIRSLLREQPRVLMVKTGTNYHVSLPSGTEVEASPDEFDELLLANLVRVTDQVSQPG